MRKRKWSIAIVCIYILLSALCSGCGFRLTPYYLREMVIDTPQLLYGSEGSDDSLLVIEKNNHFGYADTTGKVVIKPVYYDARPFHEGLAAVQQGDKYGYIDKMGKVVIPFQYYGAADFHDGVALVGGRVVTSGEVDSPRISIINARGTVLKETDYSLLYANSDGVAIVGTEDGQRAYLDHSGKEIASFQYSGQEIQRGFEAFSEGLAPFYTGNGKYAHIDVTGRIVFDTGCIGAYPFSEGLAAVIIHEEEGYGYIDQTGKTVIQPAYGFAEPFGEGLACVFTEKERWSVIDKTGQKVINLPDEISSTQSFSEGLCAVGRLTEKSSYYKGTELIYNWGFIDTTGKLVIDYQYDLVTPFKNGIAQVLVDGKIGYIDKAGKYIWEPK